MAGSPQLEPRALLPSGCSSSGPADRRPLLSPEVTLWELLLFSLKKSGAGLGEDAAEPERGLRRILPWGFPGEDEVAAAKALGPPSAAARHVGQILPEPRASRPTLPTAAVTEEPRHRAA